MINRWNKLEENMVSPSSVNRFKFRLEKKDHRIKDGTVYGLVSAGPRCLQHLQRPDLRVICTFTSFFVIFLFNVCVCVLYQADVTINGVYRICF